MVKKDFTILNKLGIHARPAAQFVKIANRFQADVFVERDGEEIDGKSIMGVMMLAAGYGSIITVTTDGSDEEAAIAATAAFDREKELTQQEKQRAQNDQQDANAEKQAATAALDETIRLRTQLAQKIANAEMKLAVLRRELPNVIKTREPIELLIKCLGSTQKDVCE